MKLKHAEIGTADLALVKMSFPLSHPSSISAKPETCGCSPKRRTILRPPTNPWLFPFLARLSCLSHDDTTKFMAMHNIMLSNEGRAHDAGFKGAFYE